MGRIAMLFIAAWAIMMGADAWRFAGGAGRGVGGRRPIVVNRPLWIGPSCRPPFAGQSGGGLAAGDVGAAADGEQGDGNVGMADAIKVGRACMCWRRVALAHSPRRPSFVRACAGNVAGC